MSKCRIKKNWLHAHLLISLIKDFSDAISLIRFTAWRDMCQKLLAVLNGQCQYITSVNHMLWKPYFFRLENWIHWSTRLFSTLSQQTTSTRRTPFWLKGKEGWSKSLIFEKFTSTIRMADGNGNPGGGPMGRGRAMLMRTLQQRPGQTSDGRTPTPPTVSTTATTRSSPSTATSRTTPTALRTATTGTGNSNSKGNGVYMSLTFIKRDLGNGLAMSA